jgi:hypothetical protein
MKMNQGPTQTNMSLSALSSSSQLTTFNNATIYRAAPAMAAFGPSSSCKKKTVSKKQEKHFEEDHTPVYSAASAFPRPAPVPTQR